MAKGVKKIKWTGEGPVYNGTRGSVPNSLLVVGPAEFVWFQVGDWYPDTTEADKKKDLKWAVQNKEGKIAYQKTLGWNYKYGFRISKALCGPYTFYVEASWSGSFDGKAGLSLRGETPARIVNSRWTKLEGGEDVRKTYHFSYGELVWLRLFTEGLNGYNNVEVRVFRRLRSAFGLLPKDDEVTRKIYFCQVINGEINLKIPNTYAWGKSMPDKAAVEEFYVRVVHPVTKAYIADTGKNGDTAHARFLRIKNEEVSQVIETPQNRVPVTIYEPDKNAARFEPCKFEQIKITEAGKSPLTVFDHGGGVKNKSNPRERVVQSIYFEIGKTELTAESLKNLNTILQFILEHNGSSIRLDGYACVIGKQIDNQVLSQNRSKTVKEFFIKGKLEAGRIKTVVGHGELNPTDDKKGRDNIKYKDEQDYINNRRVDISFEYYGHNADTIMYETILGSKPTTITVEPVNFDTKACFSKPVHKKEIKFSNPNIKNGQGGSIPAISRLSDTNPIPLNYIWPRYCLTNTQSFSSANDYLVHFHSCRYFSVENNPPVKLRVYPDIKWKLNFFLNLTNDLSVKWQNASAEQHKEYQSKAGKIGAEKRWKQKEASFGFGLLAQWNKSGENYGSKMELKASYEGKFKKLYDIFSSMGDLAKAVTDETKGAVKTSIPGVPVTIAVKPPNLSLAGEWYLKKVKNSANIDEIGTELSLTLKADPLIALEITIDLLGAIVWGAAGAISGGTAAPGVLKLYQQIKGSLKKGANLGTDDVGFKANVDIYMDLVITSSILVDSTFAFNTAGKPSDSKMDVSAKGKLKVELKVGVKVKGELALVVVRVEGYFEASASAEGSITFGHKLNYNDKGLYYRPILGFDGLDAKYVVAVSLSLAKKIKKDQTKMEMTKENKVVLAEGDYPQVIPKFDVVEKIESVFNVDANIPLITN